LYWQLFISNRNPIRNIPLAHCINHWPKFHGRFRFGAIFCVLYYMLLPSVMYKNIISTWTDRSSTKYGRRYYKSPTIYRRLLRTPT
jgi:hypothetical protein